MTTLPLSPLMNALFLLLQVEWLCCRAGPMTGEGVAEDTNPTAEEREGRCWTVEAEGTEVAAAAC